ncbi:response regulator transcription factor [Phyllobacterium sophorae]|uniref:Two-component system response regulator n=1 Tax=Phyllobacterium sophorae TaxID=1520277 RepID=A0A2P7B5V6_9HYPH|nr:response regulator [Phyllobacterium sophorae]PSH61841.1 two-component system response regulator [Phyllobacterium sophorae]
MEFVSIIDDEATVRRATSSLLRSLGFSVQTFVSAEEFLDSEFAMRTSCIVSDVHMQGMSGIDLFMRLQSCESKIPFIFITAFAEEVVRQRVGQDVCVLQKPFEAEVLASCIEQALSS